jgi:hypothetical protein
LPTPNLTYLMPPYLATIITTAAIVAAHGNVIAHDNTILESSRVSTLPFAKPTPEIEPTELSGAPRLVIVSIGIAPAYTY